MRFVVLAAIAGFGWATARPSPAADSPVVISEFLASNANVLADEDGDYADWIELRNASTRTVDLGGWFLTDDPRDLGRWRFPSTNLAPGAFLVVFASGKDRAVAGRRLHTDFRLDDAGEYLALVQPDGETRAAEFSPRFPPQATDESFGLNPQGEPRFFRPPTPGAANGAGFVSRVEETRFNVDRGFHEAPFDLVITCATPGAEIRYTTNGSPPTAATGFVWTGPLRIAGTTVVRAAGFKPGWLPSEVDTHTYLFLGDVVRQSANGAPPPGWPASWGSNRRDYGMDPDVVNDPLYRETLGADLRSIPSFCVTMHLPDLFDSSTGIYANPGQDGRAWERPMSLELVHPDGREGFQVEAGIRIRGGFSRSTGNPKHAFRFFFRRDYGPGELEYPVFGPEAADRFDGFDLRTFQNYSWSFQGDGRGTFLRDQFNRDLQLAMGHPAERGDYFHLYINGQYWGLYNTCERPEASYAATYFGGSAEDYDVIKVESGPYTILATDGTLQGWTQLYNLARGPVDDVLYRRLLGQNPDGTRNPDYPVYVDPVNLIDYLLVILYGGNLDAPISNFLGNTSPNNFFGVWNRRTMDRGFRFFVHDAEHTLLNVNEDRTGPYAAGNSSVSKSNPQWLWQRLLASPEFRILVGDRIQKHFFGEGVLTPARAREIYLRRRAEIDRAVVAESARWGDAMRASDPFTRDDDWVPAVNDNLDFLARRSSIVLAQLRSDGLVPSLEAPRFNQAGGAVHPGFGLLMSPATATIYFTLDGSDPRRPGGAVSTSARRYAGPVSLTESVTVKARTYADGTWSALVEAGFDLIQTYRELFVTEIGYHPAPDADLDGDEFEFLELKNVGTRTLDLSGVHFTDGISFRFPNGTRLPAGGFAVLVSNPEAFARRYPGRAVAGTYAGRLSNQGERLTLVHAVGTPIFSVAYGTRPPWPPLADGDGFTLVPVQPNFNPNPDSASGWRASSRIDGSPGADDPPASVVPVVISEVLTHTDPPLLDAVELHNPNPVPAPLGDWWLSDDRNEPRKFRIPAGRTIPAGGFLVLDEADFLWPTNAPGSFTFDSHGEAVWLHSGDSSGNLTGYSDGFGFGAAENGVSFGRHVNSVGAISYPAQARRTLGQTNAGPRLGPVVLNEIHFRPAAGDAEFVEIRNLSDTFVPLYDPQAPTNTWRIGGIGFAFPEAVVLPPGGLAVVAAADPALFRARFGIPESVPVYGPFPGVLQDGGETLTLERPDAPDLEPDGSMVVPYPVVDAVGYGADAPWPVPTFGGVSLSLERRSPVGYGDDPASWRAGPGEPSPGADNDGNRPPRVDAGPDQEVESTSFPAAVTLAGGATDDGLPVAPGRLSVTWSAVQGPGVVEFDEADRTNTVVRLPGSGIYTLRLTATDGERTRWDEVLVRAGRPSEARVLLPAGSTWRYRDDGVDLGSAWRESGYDDAGWTSGRAPLGFGDGDEQTVLAAATGGNRTATFYFRAGVIIPDPAAVTGLKAALVRDDGAVVYVNGREVARSNMPEGAIQASTLANEVVGGADESAFFDYLIDPAVLVAGTNVLAVEVHQQNLGSTDVSFDLRLDAAVQAGNRRPLVDAGPDRSASVEESVVLAGSYQDDGLPAPPGVVRLEWRQLEGPGPARFSATNVTAPRLTFPTPGRYLLQLIADDTEFTVTDEVAVAVVASDYQAWREKYFSAAELVDPTRSGDDADPDEDGQRNRAEYLSGTHPRDPSSVLRLRVAGFSDGRLTLWVPVITGRRYTVLSRDVLSSGDWSVLQALEPAPCDCDLEVRVETPSTGGARFYRVITPGSGP